VDLSFLRPSFLAWLPVAALPLLIHWLTRSRPVRRPFSSLELLRSIAVAHGRRSRWRHLLLLACRCALLASLAVLFARPVLHRNPAASADDPAVLVLLADVSYSMDARHAGGRLLERAAAQALDVLQSAGPRDRVGLVVFSDRVELSIPPTGDRAKVREALESLAVTARPTRVRPALEVAYQMLAGLEGAQKSVVLFSDLAENGWRDGGAGGPPVNFDPAVRVVLAESGPPVPNGAVTSARWRPGEDGAGFRGSFESLAWGQAEARGWSVLVEDRVVARGRLAAGSPRTAFSAPAPSADPGAGEVRLEADGLPLDDRYHCRLSRPEGFSLLVVNGAPGLSPVQDEAYFLSPVLEALSKGGLRWRAVTAEQLESEPAAGWDVLAFLNVGALSAGKAAEVRDHLRRGKGVWLTVGDRFDPAGALASLAPVRFQGVVDAAEPLRAPEASPSDRLAAALAEEGGFEWEKARVERVWESVPTEDAAVALATRLTGRPLLVTGRALGGPVAVLTTTVDRDWTSLPSKPLFPILCRETLAYLSGRSGQATGFDLRVDQPFDWKADGPLPSMVDVRRPDGEVDAVPARQGRVAYARTDRPGLYRVTAGGRDLALFAVNLAADSGEGDTRRAAKAAVEAVLPARDVLWVPHPQPAGERLRERVRGKDLTAAFALAALLLFLLEGLLSARRTGKAESRAEAFRDAA
jgi:hypothetical protein